VLLLLRNRDLRQTVSARLADGRNEAVAASGPEFLPGSALDGANLHEGRDAPDVVERGEGELAAPEDRDEAAAEEGH